MSRIGVIEFYHSLFFLTRFRISDGCFRTTIYNMIEVATLSAYLEILSTMLFQSEEMKVLTM